MNKYTLTIRRTDIGTVTIEAESAEDAERKYWCPKDDEPLIMDDEIEWYYEQAEYEVSNIEEVE